MNGINEGDFITNGSQTAFVAKATEAFLICVPEDGEGEFVLNATAATSWRNKNTAGELVIERPFIVYAPDGTRVDGYKFESRALRNNKERFAGSGFWIAKANPADFTWVPA
jgi:hypothetical protein